MRKEWVFPGMTLESLPQHLGAIHAAYNKYGVVIFPGMLTGNPALAGFLEALRFLFTRILAQHGIPVGRGEELGDLLVTLGRTAPLDGRDIADLGTQPNKLVEANRLKYSDFVVLLLRTVFGKDAILATPHSGDTLHLFMPGPEFHRYNLPVHQDYQYLMQSPKQATLYLGLSKPHPGVGGLEYWPCSHRKGVLKSTHNINGSFQIVDAENTLAGLLCESYSWEVGDVGLFDSLLCHRSIPNATADRARIVQIFRFSDLNDTTGEGYRWRSTVYPRRSLTFQDIHPELFVAPESQEGPAKSVS